MTSSPAAVSNFSVDVSIYAVIICMSLVKPGQMPWSGVQDVPVTPTCLRIRLPCFVSEFSLFLFCLSLISFNPKKNKERHELCYSSFSTGRMRYSWCWNPVCFASTVAMENNTNIAITTSQMDASAPRLYLASTSLDYTYSITIKELIKQQCDRQWKSDHHI